MGLLPISIPWLSCAFALIDHLKRATLYGLPRTACVTKSANGLEQWPRAASLYLLVLHRVAREQPDQRAVAPLFPFLSCNNVRQG